MQLFYQIAALSDLIRGTEIKQNARKYFESNPFLYCGYIRNLYTILLGRLLVIDTNKLS